MSSTPTTVAGSSAQTRRRDGSTPGRSERRAHRRLRALFAVSGMLLWLGERDTRFRLDGTIVLHDVLTYASVALVAGHLYLAVIHPTTRHALRGITRGSVREDWAREHHAKWPTDAQ